MRTENQFQFSSSERIFSRGQSVAGDSSRTVTVRKYFDPFFSRNTLVL